MGDGLLRQLTAGEFLWGVRGISPCKVIGDEDMKKTHEIARY